MPTKLPSEGSEIGAVTPSAPEAGAPWYPPVLLYDGDCGMCAGIVQLILRADRRGTLHFASLNSEFARGVLIRHPVTYGVDSMAWVERGPFGERVLLRSEAAMRICAYLGGVWRLVEYLGRIIPEQWQSKAYDMIARRRLHWFGQASSCPVLSPDQHHRFIA
jgi:predicted DCC family thiol-disulfide oxidoreductase YuxK